MASQGERTFQFVPCKELLKDALCFLIVLTLTALGKRSHCNLIRHFLKFISKLVWVLFVFIYSMWDGHFMLVILNRGNKTKTRKSTRKPMNVCFMKDRCSPFWIVLSTSSLKRVEILLFFSISIRKLVYQAMKYSVNSRASSWQICKRRVRSMWKVNNSVEIKSPSIFITYWKN